DVLISSLSGQDGRGGGGLFEHHRQVEDRWPPHGKDDRKQACEYQGIGDGACASVPARAGSLGPCRNRDCWLGAVRDRPLGLHHRMLPRSPAPRIHRMTNAPTRPAPDEYAPFYAGYVQRVPEPEIVPVLRAQ